MRALHPLRFLVLATALLAGAPSARAADAWFNSDPAVELTDLIVDAMDRNVIAANGAPVEFRANIFSFTERTIAEKMLTLAKDHPNLAISIVTDWSQLSTSGSHMAPFLEEVAKGNYDDACDGLERTEAKRAACVTNLEGLLGGAVLPNIRIRYKKDDPYRWDASKGRAVYHHGSTDGLNHHKGIAFVHDGVPTELLTGSFNWSPTANDSNYENLMAFTRDVPAERELIRAWTAEQGAMFHNAAVTLSGPDARAYKSWVMERHAFLNGAAADPGPEPSPTLGAGDQPITVCPLPGAEPTLEELLASVEDAVAVSGGAFRPQPVNLNTAPIAELVSALGITESQARKIRTERARNGGFADVTDLKNRVPGLSNLPVEAFAGTEFGTDRIAVNHATAEELTGLYGVGDATANRITAWIAANGPMERLSDLRAAGLSDWQVSRIQDRVDLRYSEAFFSARHLDCPEAGTGFAAVNATNTTTVRNESGAGVSVVEGSLPAPAVDLFRRAQAGQTIRVAAYGLSASAPEYQALQAAVARGAKVQVILNRAYNDSVAGALASLAQQHPGAVEVKWFSSRTMHQKYGIVGDDVFNGSANLNTSSTGKHAEDRFLIKNDPELAAKFEADFQRLWDRATWVVGAPDS